MIINVRKRPCCSCACVFILLSRFQIPSYPKLIVVGCSCDFSVSMAILSGYAGLFVLFKIKGALTGSAPVEEAAPAASSSPVIASTGIPPVDTPEFDKYLETDAFYNMLDNDEQLAKVVEDMK